MTNAIRLRNARTRIELQVSNSVAIPLTLKFADTVMWSMRAEIKFYEGIPDRRTTPDSEKNTRLI